MQDGESYDYVKSRANTEHETCSQTLAMSILETTSTRRMLYYEIHEPGGGTNLISSSMLSPRDASESQMVGHGTAFDIGQNSEDRLRVLDRPCLQYYNSYEACAGGTHIMWPACTSLPYSI